ncbi:MAG: ATP-dependent helicase HrpB [Hyphomonas sp.]|nr:ATP-dependent helicase HrpB [Hyphomonas sp.]MBU3919583.1 ATP-dependent helicase HrpB [Alphaproteobacteria bacterium]MBU4060716.1 ATP-dependent helicase HrpB [Alphaproteobacteria bacterium]MBU4164700.1 ATP-dependent helicase HrpB [Alphaproteobacteria bacterium]MBU4568045.1 ATP-dependent helicase HrpB [Alphaproteobacteria bacterium]
MPASMTAVPDPLPIDDVLPAILERLREGNRLVLAAPPGAGKTTRVPLALAGLLGKPGVIAGRILMLEPRRIAARMAAERMASSLGERLGQTVGLTTRVDRKVSAETRIEVITDGLFTRRILNDPELKGVGAVVFDEFHERRLNSDLGLALALEAQGALREDLRLLIMSATLDTAAVARAVTAPVIESAGRQYPVETRYLGRSEERIEDRMPKAIRQALREQEGSILAFLPGAREIHRTADALSGLGPEVLVAPLFGALSPAEQDGAVSPAPPGKRKVVLATDLAESALTIEGVRIVIDSGLARVAEDEAGGLGTRLSTVRASRASADQRRGRAGRTAPGACYRLWDEAATRGLLAAPVPEILAADLSGLVLALAEWGERDPSKLVWLDPPPPGKYRAAEAQLLALGALDASGAMTAKGREMARLPMAPRLAALIAAAPGAPEKALAAEVAALAGERGMGGDSSDLRDRLQRFRADGSGRARSLRTQAASWGGGAKPGGDLARLLAAAWPDQVARRRPGSEGSYLMASGRAANIPATDGLAKSEWLVVADLGGAARDPRITLALPLTEAEALAGQKVVSEDRAAFDPKSARFTARRVKALGAIVLSESPLPKPPAAAAASAMLAAVEASGFAALGADEAVEETLSRLRMLETAGLIEAPAKDIAALVASAPEWLSPLLRRKGASVPSPQEVRDALTQSFDWPVQEALRQHAPLSLDLPSGQTARVDWLDPRAPLVSARAQAFYGLTEHPKIAAGRVPVTVELLSPGMKPAAATQDIARFWGAGYKDMAKDMRGRYPKHDWPDDPAHARAHEGRTKKRLT